MAGSTPAPRLVIGLTVALAAALAVIAFLLGRESMRPAPAQQRVPVVEDPSALPAADQSAPASTSPQEGTKDPEAAAIAAYLKQVDTIQSAAVASNPKSFAMELMGG